MADEITTPSSQTPGEQLFGKETTAAPVTETKETTAAPVTEPKEPKSILDDPSKAPSSEKSIMDDSIDEAGQAENKRLLEADPKTLNEEELKARGVLEEAKRTEAAKTVPEKYELKLPDGMSTDMGLIEKLTPTLKEIGITGEQAQKLADIYAPHIKAQSEAQQKSFQDAQETNFKNFLESEKKNTMDKLGANAKADLVFAAKSRDRFLSKESQEMLNAAGIANNYSFISDLIRMGKAISEEKLVEGKRVTSDTRSDGEVLYGGKKDKGE